MHKIQIFIHIYFEWLITQKIGEIIRIDLYTVVEIIFIIPTQPLHYYNILTQVKVINVGISSDFAVIGQIDWMKL